MCDTESVFTHVTVVPAATLKSSGEKARLPSVAAPAGMVMDGDDPTGLGVGDGVGAAGLDGVEYPLPQAIAKMRIVGTTARRSESIFLSLRPCVISGHPRIFRTLSIPHCSQDAIDVRHQRIDRAEATCRVRPFSPIVTEPCAHVALGVATEADRRSDRQRGLAQFISRRILRRDARAP